MSVVQKHQPYTARGQGNAGINANIETISSARSAAKEESEPPKYAALPKPKKKAPPAPTPCYKKAFAFWMDWVVNIHSKIAGKPLIVYKAPSLFPHDKKSNVKHNNLKEIAVMIITVACIAKMITTTSEKYNSVKS